MKEKKGFIWNTIGSLVYSFLNAIMLMVCTRLNGVEIAGMFSISYATGCILNAIGDFGIRIYQVTDTERKFKFEDYFFSRIIAILIMLLSGIAFVFISGYTAEKIFICITLILVRVVDNFSETFQAEFQLNERLELAGKVLFVRNLIELIIFTLVDYFTKNIFISLGSMLISGIIILLFFDLRITSKIIKIKLKFNKDDIKKILKECLPLCISTLVSMYVINSVKYSIDLYGNNEMQTYFNILYMPTFAINLISLLLIKPFLKPFGEYWNSKDYKSFFKCILFICIALILSCIFIEVVCAFIGIQVLNILYKVDISLYKIELLVLIISGLFYAISTVFFYALGTIRRQKSSTIVYGVVAILALIISNVLVNKYKLLGATIASTVIMLSLLIGLLIAFIIGLKKEKIVGCNNK